MICRVCPGTGWLLHMFKPAPDEPSVMEFWRCPCCGGNGARIVYGPAEIGPGTRKKK